MAEYRCPKHDRIFETYTDLRKPGALATPDGKLAAHPHDGHPDCPKCQEELAAAPPAVVNTAQTGTRRIG